MASQKVEAQKGANLAILFWSPPVKYLPSLIIATLWAKLLMCGQTLEEYIQTVVKPQ